MSETSLTETRESEGVDPKAVQRKRILLVEGDGFTRLVLLLRLRLAGFGVDFTSNGILGLGKLRSCRPDVLLLELKLCGMSGLELIKAARAEPGFGGRPIYVYTHTDRMNRATRKEVGLLATKVFDKASITREDLVQTFAPICQDAETTQQKRPSSNQTPAPARRLREAVPASAIEELVAGVREQSQRLTKQKENRASNSAELLSRVCSLASCAEVAGLPNLARQSKTLENFLIQLCRSKEAHPTENLRTVTQAVEVMRHMSFDGTGEEQRLTRYTAVLVDEAPGSNQAIQGALREAGFEPHCFEEPSVARAFLASNRTDVIIANVILPEAHSLTLSDIRQLPLHAETKVIFGPDSAAMAPLGERLPTSAARFDNDALLLTSMVMRALNLVQMTDKDAPAELEPAPEEADTVQMRNPAANQAFDDGFEMFARTSSPSSDRVLESEPSSTDHAPEAELLIRQVPTPIDQTQVDEQAMELLPPPDLVAQESQSPEPELPTEDNTAAAAWLAADNADCSHPIVAQNETSELEPNEPLALEATTAVTSNYEESMSNPSHDVAAYATRCDNGQSDQPLETAAPERADLAARVCEAEMALHQARVELEQKDREIAALQEHLAAATADQSQNGVRLGTDQDAQVRCAELEQELTALRQALDDFNGSFGQQQQAAAEAGKYVQELELRLSQKTAEHEKHSQDLQQQLEAANAAQQELASKLAQEQKASAETSERLKKLESQRQEAERAASSDPEQQIRQGVAALARVTAELAKERGERQRSEQRTAELNERLQALHHDLSRTLQAQRDDLARISTLEEHQRQTNQALERRTADLEQLQAERQLSEEQLHKEKELSAQLRKDLSFFDEINKKFGGTSQELQAQLEASLNAARDHEAMLEQKNAEQQRLAESLEGLNQQLQKQTRRSESLEQELQNAQQSVQEREAKLQKESAERQRLKEALDSAQRNLRGGSERDLEFSKLQSALQLEQVERKRQEAQLARMRHNALDSAHAARSLRAGLRRQIREPVDNLVQSARSLLEFEMGDAQKKLAESVLQDVLLVQTRLREPENAHGEPTEPTATPDSTET